MTYQLICEVEPVDATCSTGWLVSEIVPSDFDQLLTLLTFDLDVFGVLLGSCIVIFIMGYSVGHVMRILGRA